VIDDQMTADATADRPQLALGADIARAGDDRTVIVAVGPHGTAEVLTSDPEMSLSDATGELARLHDSHDISHIAVDATGLGAGVVEMLESSVAPRLIEGIKFTIDRKQSLYNQLKSELEDGALTLAYDGKLLRELRQLEYSLTGRGKTKIHHPSGGHDDHTDALALAAHARRGGAPGDGYARTSDDVVVL